jgi:hypothetical protein
MNERSKFQRELDDLALRDYDVTPKPKPRKPAPLLPNQCSQVSPWPDIDCGKAKPPVSLELRRIARLQSVIRKGMLTTSPRDSSLAGKGLFSGSWDWHSAVHAHWALLCIARYTNDAELEEFLIKRLDDKALKAEYDFLKKEKSFEFPYGRAWLLLMFSELARRASRAKAIARIQNDLETSLIGWLETNPYPESGTTAAPVFNAAHDSWLFAYLLTVMSQPKTKSSQDRLHALYQKKVEPQRSAIAKVISTPTDFLYLPAVQAVINRIDPAATYTAGDYPLGVSPALLDPPLNSSNAHSAGAALVRIWPHAIDSHKGDNRACSRFHTRLNEFFSRTDHWADSFDQIAHWVPQFMWMGIWLEAGRP